MAAVNINEIMFQDDPAETLKKNIRMLIKSENLKDNQQAIEICSKIGSTYMNIMACYLDSFDKMPADHKTKYHHSAKKANILTFCAIMGNIIGETEAVGKTISMNK